MKRLLTVAMLLLAGAAQAYPSMTAADVEAYKARTNLYISMGQRPEQVVVSLRNYFGKSYFYTDSTGNAWQHRTDIVVRNGFGLEIIDFRVLGSMNTTD